VDSHKSLDSLFFHILDTTSSLLIFLGLLGLALIIF